MKFTLSEIAKALILVLSIYLIWNFFSEYNYYFLIAGILFPIIAGFLSNQYCLTNTLMLFFIALGIGGYFYFEVPNNLFAGCAAVYIILWKIVRKVVKLTKFL